MIHDFSRSKALQKRSHALIPGGAHTYAKGDDQYPEQSPAFIASGKGCHVWDVDGNEYVEYGMGNRAVTLGHAYEPVVRAAQREMVGCGGTLLTLLERNPELEVTWVVLSGDPVRRAEAARSAGGLLEYARHKTVVLENFRDAYFPYEGAKIKDFFHELGDSVDPDLIFTHRREDGPSRPPAGFRTHLERLSRPRDPRV